MAYHRCHLPIEGRGRELRVDSWPTACASLGLHTHLSREQSPQHSPIGATHPYEADILDISVEFFLIETDRVALGSTHDSSETGVGTGRVALRQSSFRFQ